MIVYLKQCMLIGHLKASHWLVLWAKVKLRELRVRCRSKSTRWSGIHVFQFVGSVTVTLLKISESTFFFSIASSISARENDDD